MSDCCWRHRRVRAGYVDGTEPIDGIVEATRARPAAARGG